MWNNNLLVCQTPKIHFISDRCDKLWLDESWKQVKTEDRSQDTAEKNSRDLRFYCIHMFRSSICVLRFDLNRFITTYTLNNCRLQCPLTVTAWDTPAIIHLSHLWGRWDRLLHHLVGVRTAPALTVRLCRGWGSVHPDDRERRHRALTAVCRLCCPQGETQTHRFLPSGHKTPEQYLNQHRNGGATTLHTLQHHTCHFYTHVHVWFLFTKPQFSPPVILENIN